MHDALLASMFIGFIMMVLVWAALCSWVFRRLERAHPEKYSDIGEPSLFFRNTIQNNFYFFRFLWKSEFKPLGDPVLTWMCNFMKILSVIYVVLYLSIIFFDHARMHRAL